MRRIRLTRGKWTLVDNKDHKRLVRFKWYAWTNRGQWAAVRMIGPRGDRTMIYMHRVILGLRTREVDHKNGRGLDNRRRNLRPATRLQNQRNRHRCWSASGYKGVYRVNRECVLRRPWLAQIGMRGKTVHLGYYASAVAAARAYDAAAQRLFGKFANINVRRL